MISRHEGYLLLCHVTIGPFWYCETAKHSLLWNNFCPFETYASLKSSALFKYTSWEVSRTDTTFRSCNSTLRKPQWRAVSSPIEIVAEEKGLRPFVVLGSNIWNILSLKIQIQVVSESRDSPYVTIFMYGLSQDSMNSHASLRDAETINLRD